MAEVQIYNGFDFANFRKITFETMTNYISEYHPEDKAEFKKVAIQKVVREKTLKSGKVKRTEKEQYVHIVASRWFYAKYFPQFLPVAKEKKENSVDAKDKLKDW